MYLAVLISRVIFYARHGHQIKERGTQSATTTQLAHAFINFSGGVIIEHQPRAVYASVERRASANVG